MTHGAELGLAPIRLAIEPGLRVRGAPFAAELLRLFDLFRSHHPGKRIPEPYRATHPHPTGCGPEALASDTDVQVLPARPSASRSSAQCPTSRLLKKSVCMA